MQANPLLSIVIPTYNRANFLDYCLEVHIPLAKTHNIQIFISDNASTDTTKEIVQKRMEEYPLISYHCNETNIGPDENIERALKYPQTDYVWLLGDTYEIPYEGIGYVLGQISKKGQKYDAILFNVGNEIKNIETQDYSDQNMLLHDMFWLMTCLSTLVYSSQLIANANFERYRNTNFIQTGVIFEYIANKKFLIHWTRSHSVRRILFVNGHKKQTWIEDGFFKIWIERRTNLVLSLPPSYNIDIKLKCIMGNGENQIGIKSLLYFRYLGVLGYKDYKKYSHLFPLTIKCPKLIILLIALLPQVIPFLLYKSYHVFKRWNTTTDTVA